MKEHEYFDLTPEQDEKVEQAVDTQGISYHEARLRLGYASLKKVAEADSVRGSRKVNRKHTNGPQYGDEEGVGYPNGKPSYYAEFKPLSDKQADINSAGLAKAREALGEAKPQE